MIQVWFRQAASPRQGNKAALYHLYQHFGWTDLIYTHISGRVAGGGQDIATQGRQLERLNI